MIYVITVAFCPAAQLARTLLEFKEQDKRLCKRHIIVNGHYPRNYEKNQSDTKILIDSYNRAMPEHYRVEYWDPGSDIGSAQSQNWVLNELAEHLTDKDFFINLDPDAACDGWVEPAFACLVTDPNLIVVSCNAPMVKHFVETRYQQMEDRVVAGVNLMVPDIPTPFNLSMWRYSFIRDLGGIPQMFPQYGEVEGPVFQSARAHGYYNAYLKDYMENEEGKLMHDKSFEDWKEAHARQHTFLGTYAEFCQQHGLS
jgi:hypothetical protein